MHIIEGVTIRQKSQRYKQITIMKEMHETVLQGNTYITGRMVEHNESAQPITKKIKNLKGRYNHG
ncbi:Uncharacterised protein [Exiguobacterium aurantiacum]|uniref:Uncharacterized protein n=1 Tax=Exiguobacterium aurantiacum TaxID=33987 RepID=A0A377FWK3_9BACL|nr:Uncharacterised protein [Exiguobacterium aurantiacum]